MKNVFVEFLFSEKDKSNPLMTLSGEDLLSFYGHFVILPGTLTLKPLTIAAYSGVRIDTVEQKIFIFGERVSVTGKDGLYNCRLIDHCRALELFLIQKCQHIIKCINQRRLIEASFDSKSRVGDGRDESWKKLENL